MCFSLLTRACCWILGWVTSYLPVAARFCQAFFHSYGIANYHENSSMVGKGKELLTSLAAVGDTISGKLKTISCTVGKKKKKGIV